MHLQQYPPLSYRRLLLCFPSQIWSSCRWSWPAFCSRCPACHTQVVHQGEACWWQASQCPSRWLAAVLELYTASLTWIGVGLVAYATDSHRSTAMAVSLFLKSLAAIPKNTSHGLHHNTTYNTLNMDVGHVSKNPISCQSISRTACPLAAASSSIASSPRLEMNLMSKYAS
eukprot:jgi/Ulvmu1/5108/UM021_0125.1